jgi:hypothetical protein
MRNDLYLEQAGLMVEKMTFPVQAKVLLAAPEAEIYRIAGNPGSRDVLRVDEVTAAADAAQATPLWG